MNHNSTICDASITRSSLILNGSAWAWLVGKTSGGERRKYTSCGLAVTLGSSIAAPTLSSYLTPLRTGTLLSANNLPHLSAH